MSREELKEMLNRQKEIEFYKHQDQVVGKPQ